MPISPEQEANLRNALILAYAETVGCEDPAAEYTKCMLIPIAEAIGYRFYLANKGKVVRVDLVPLDEFYKDQEDEEDE